MKVSSSQSHQPISCVQQPRVASDYHIGQCRYRTLSSLQKVLLNNVALVYSLTAQFLNLTVTRKSHLFVGFSRAEVGKYCLPVFLVKFYWNTATPVCLPMAAFVLQQQSCVEQLCQTKCGPQAHSVHSPFTKSLPILLSITGFSTSALMICF